MPDYIPGREAQKMNWLREFVTWVAENGATHGFSPAEITALTTAHDQAETAVHECYEQKTAYRAAVAAKHSAITSAINLARSGAMRLQSYPATTDGSRAAAGLTVRDTNRTPAPPDEILAIEPPLLLLDFSIRRQVIIHWGPNPAKEHSNARPKESAGCEIQFARGGIPTEEAAWTVLKIDTGSPCIHAIHDTEPITIAYRARYIDKQFNYGPFSAPATCTVSV